MASTKTEGPELKKMIKLGKKQTLPFAFCPGKKMEELVPSSHNLEVSRNVPCGGADLTLRALASRTFEPCSTAHENLMPLDAGPHRQSRGLYARRPERRGLCECPSPVPFLSYHF